MFSQVLSEEIQGKLVQGDCLEVMKKIPDKSIDMILCDLPYGTTACKWDTIIPFEPLWKQYKRIIKDRGAIVLFGTEPFSSHLRLSNLKMYKYDWTWKKNYSSGIAFAKYQPMRNSENISVFYKQQCIFNKQLAKSEIKDRKLGGYNGRYGGKGKDRITGLDTSVFNKKQKLKPHVNPKTVIEFNVPPRSKGYLHPTQKPVKLFEYLIKTYTNENDIVLDNCIGSGTTAIAAENLKRRWIGIELESEYVRLAKERIERERKERASRLF